MQKTGLCFVLPPGALFPVVLKIRMGYNNRKTSFFGGAKDEDSHPEFATSGINHFKKFPYFARFSLLFLYFYSIIIM